MRLLLASLAAVTAVAFAAPSFAQDTPSTPTPITKPAKHKTSTASSCGALKSDSAKAACLKRQHAHATKPHKTTKKVANKSSASGQPAPTDSVPAAQPAPSPSQSQSIAVPPLPQKTL
jgi:hypothetical protein